MIMNWAFGPCALGGGGGRPRVSYSSIHLTRRSARILDTDLAKSHHFWTLRLVVFKRVLPAPESLVLGYGD